MNMMSLFFFSNYILIPQLDKVLFQNNFIISEPLPKKKRIVAGLCMFQNKARYEVSDEIEKSYKLQNENNNNS